MLGNKVKPRRLNSKGNLSIYFRELCLDTKFSKVGRALSNSIPVLSIFALVGISLFMITVGGMASVSNKASAESYTETSGNSSITLTIGGAGETEQVAAGRGVATYRSHTVRVQANVVNDYALTIAGPANLTAPSGGTTIAGANNTTGDKMTDNTWGYGWGATNAGDSDLTYRALSTTGTDILTVNGANDKPTLTNRAVDFTKKLAFAVKFADNAVPGRYYANVTLSLTATPAILTTYSVAYNANGGTGTSSPASQSAQSYESSHTFTAAAQGSMAKSGYNFLGWSESSSASSASYTAGSSTINLTATNPSKTLYAVWQRVYTYSVTYNCNGGSGCPSSWSTTSTSTSYSHTVKSGTPTRTGYSFLGWSTSSTATSASYVAGNTISLTSSSPSRTLYAVWKQVSTIKTITNMQQMTAAICAASATGDANTLTDTRDGSTYTVKKLNSTQCWMTQNLRIVNKTITSTDSNVTSNFTIPASSTSGFSSDTASNVYYNNNNTTYGAYYTWCAATAGTCSSATAAGTNASASICPKGWYLPVSGTGTSGTNTGASSDTKNDFMVMAGKTSTDGFTDASLVSGTNITLGTTTWPFAGRYLDSSPSNVGTDGCFWSRTASSSAYTYRLLVNRNGRVYLANGDLLYRRRSGLSVRCVAYSS